MVTQTLVELIGMILYVRFLLVIIRNEHRRQPACSYEFARPRVRPPGVAFKPGRRFTVEGMEILLVFEVGQRTGVPASTMRHYEGTG